MAVFLVFAILVIGNCATEDHTGNNRTAFVSRVCFTHLKRRRYRQGNRQGQKRFDEKVGYPHGRSFSLPRQPEKTLMPA